ncbi:MAG: polysaccharide biosynthesis/export family protein [Xanthomonadales bacterium]
MKSQLTHQQGSGRSPASGLLHAASGSSLTGGLHVRARLRATFFSLRFLSLIFMFLSLIIYTPTWAQNEAPADTDVSYRLGAGDKLQIDVFNQADLTGEYTLDGNGHFTMHLIGRVDAVGKTPTELEALLIGKLKPDYLVNPRISVRVKSYRPFYIIGEVKSPSSYAYVDGMTYLTAVAIAGGFTYRAKKDRVYVVRGGDAEGEETRLDVNEKVRPGDIIRVAERMF